MGESIPCRTGSIAKPDAQDWEVATDVDNKLERAAGGVDVADFRVFSVGIGVSFTCSGVFPKLVPVNNGATGGFSLGISICFPFSPVLTGFTNENGNEVIGGSLALLRSCSIVVD